MIVTEKSVPRNYYARSRDFQLIGRVLDCVFNSSKLYSYMVLYDTICKNTDIRLLDLIARTAGFNVKREYDAKDLYTLCSAFSLILKHKGTLPAIEDCVKVLLKAQNIDADFAVDQVYDLANKPLFKVNILIPKELNDIALLEDMLDYVLPAGYTYSIIVVSDILSGISSNVGAMRDTVSTTPYKSSKLGHVFDDTIADKNKTELTVVYRSEDE